MKVARWLVIPDPQVPYHDKRSLAAVEKYMADERWDGVIYLGDLMDFDCISSFNKENLRAIETKRLQKDYDIANEILDRHQKIVRARNRRATFVLIEGNHEYRVERLIDANPALEGLFEVPIKLRLKQRGFKWVPYWSKGDTYRVGRAVFVHGQYTTKYHAAKMVDAYGSSVFYGHTHDMMCYPRVHRGKEDLQVGQSLGCLCERDQAYMKGKPSNWQQGFGVFYFLPNGLYNYYTPRIIRHAFVAPNGKVYEG